MGLGYGKERRKRPSMNKAPAAVLRELAEAAVFEVSAASGFLETTTE